jgi:hypothetical protein
MGKTWTSARGALSVLALLWGGACPSYCQTSATTGLWQKGSFVDSLSGKTVVYVTLDPTSDTDNEFQQTGIIIRCKADQTVDFQLQWDQKMTADASLDTYSVNYRIGNGAVQSETWNLSTDNASVFYIGNVAAFILHLQTSNAFVAQVTPTGMNPITATYDMTGMGPAVAPVLQACGFNQTPS